MPEPAFRPGDTPDFSTLKVPAAGERAAPRHRRRRRRDSSADDGARPRARRRQPGASARGTRSSTPDTLREMLRDMVAVRVFDDRMYRAQRQGKTSFYMKCTGEEAIAVAAALALDREDMCFPTYRQQGLLIARGYPLVEMMYQIYSNRGDKLKGRQLPIMYSDQGARLLLDLAATSRTQFPQAVGWAMASAIKGDSRIAAGLDRRRRDRRGRLPLRR